MKIVVTRDDGSEQDVTEEVRIAFDVGTHSMDWGSGFLDIEETNGLLRLADACGFPALEELLQEQWRTKMAYGKSWDELQALSQERGADFWHLVRPTDQERAAVLAEIRGSEATSPASSRTPRSSADTGPSA